MVFFATQLWRNRRLIWRLALTQLRDRYASTAIGSLWAVLQPILVMLVFWFVFTYALRQGTPTDGAPFVLFLIIGLGVWFALSDALLNGANAVTQNAYLITKIAFPLEVLPVVPVVVAVIVHAAMMLIIVVLMIAMGSPPSVSAVGVLLYGTAMFVLATGLSYLLSATNVFYRDMAQSLGVVLQVWFWITPIVWSPDTFSDAMRYYLRFNPMYYIVIGYRHALLPSAPSAGLVETASFWSTTVVVLIAGVWVFRRVQADFADVL